MKKIGLGILIIAIVLMVIGLILIGVFKDEVGYNGFAYCNWFGAGTILGLPGMELVKWGIVFAVILAPILGGIGIIIIGYLFYKKHYANKK